MLVQVLGSMNIEQISKVMDHFERSFEDMDVRSEYVEQTMNSSTTAAMPEEEVDTLMQVSRIGARSPWCTSCIRVHHPWVVGEDWARIGNPTWIEPSLVAAQIRTRPGERWHDKTDNACCASAPCCMRA
uniref:Uncharacterized protein n=1 Tax=Calcidiscus leptoporus TaxID=127549 RepID=A0A7S0NRI1_9EUKA|mmetsp:Transcript_19819/g.45674  ORF Transcript_19819/g.45674 Transcript_19819/m.45674 type:complete len:129 (+) Transcript_19819:420-806(+)